MWIYHTANPTYNQCASARWSKSCYESKYTDEHSSSPDDTDVKKKDDINVDEEHEVMETSDEDPAYVVKFKSTFRTDLETRKEHANIAYLKIATALDPRFKDLKCIPRAQRGEFVSLRQRILSAVQKNATRGDPRSVIRAIDQFCSQKEWAMNVGNEKGCILDSVVSEVNPATVLELGTYCGYSTVRIASLLPPYAKFITLEFNPDFAAVARQVIAWAGLEDKVQLVEGASSDWIPKIKEQFGIKTFDLVFLDHWKEHYLSDTKLMEECGLLRKGSVLLADNVICPGAPDYVEYVRSSPRYKSHYFRSHLEYTKAEENLWYLGIIE
uniref:catechol O-methyltransferase-like n=1 Tax=Monopterus albus TaxID=43700 RepID=UPI0009B3E170|nr:catechol O-methyltransferase-like [Monopterus albus]